MIAVDSFRRDFGYLDPQGEAILPAEWQAAFNTIASVGQIFGGFLCSWAADRIGRRYSLICGLIICTGGIAGEIASDNRPAFLASKLVLGFGLGFYLTLAPLACSEIAPVAFRGFATAGVNLGIAVGQLLSNAVVKAFGERTDAWAYKGGFSTQLFFVLFLVVFLPFLPESPWYLVRAGKKEQAIKTIKKLYGKDYDAESQILAMEATIAEESAILSEQRLVDCFRGTNLLRTGISTGVFLCQHLVGIIFVLGYSTYFLGWSASSSPLIWVLASQPAASWATSAPGSWSSASVAAPSSSAAWPASPGCSSSSESWTWCPPPPQAGSWPLRRWSTRLCIS